MPQDGDKTPLVKPGSRGPGGTPANEQGVPNYQIGAQGNGVVTRKKWDKHLEDINEEWDENLCS